MRKAEEQDEDLGHQHQQKKGEKEKEEKDIGEMKKIIKETMTAGTPKDQVGFHYFRLFSYLSMAILSAAILVGMFIIIQHLIEEEQQKDTLGRQESVLKNQELLLALNQNQTDSLELTLYNQKNIIKNQDLISVLLNETRRDNTAFFGILANMTKAESDEVNEIIATNEKLDKIIEYLQIK